MNEKLSCSSCGTEYARPASLATSMFQQAPFICELCRCADCGIVLHYECSCGELHAEPSSSNPKICSECEYIRERVAILDPELLQLRLEEIEREDQLYGIPMAAFQPTTKGEHRIN